MKRLPLIAAILVAGLLLGMLGSRLLHDSGDGEIVARPPSGGDFILQSPSGPFNLEEHRGKVVLIYFGYTFCPDICPTNLALMSQALNALTAEEVNRVQGVFISVDPDRDTLEKLDNYADYFHGAIVGVTGTKETLAQVARQYGAAYRKVEGESKGGYLVDHSSNTYVLSPDGSLHTILPHAAPPQEILELVRRLLATG